METCPSIIFWVCGSRPALLIDCHPLFHWFCGPRILAGQEIKDSIALSNYRERRTASYASPVICTIWYNGEKGTLPLWHFPPKTNHEKNIRKIQLDGQSTEYLANNPQNCQDHAKQGDIITKHNMASLMRSWNTTNPKIQPYGEKKTWKNRN